MLLRFPLGLAKSLLRVVIRYMDLQQKRSNKSDKKSTLFVGRWQPFHGGHRELIETVLKKGKPVVVAIRDTDIDQKNPYTIYERWTAIQQNLKKYGALVKIVVIPDIDEICYGRNVGYAIRRIEMGSDVEKISGTVLRKKNQPYRPIIWLTGQTGSGKTTIARALQGQIGGIVLDGDEMRESISTGLGFGKQDREEHNLRVARLATVLSKKNLVIVSVIAPFKQTRERIDVIAKPVWVYVERDIPGTKEKPYEAPKNYQVKVNSDQLAPMGQVNVIIQYLKKKRIIHV
jgi:cytidyltransferase-like protein